MTPKRSLKFELIWNLPLARVTSGNAHPNSLNPYFHSQTLLCVVPSASTSPSEYKQKFDPITADFTPGNSPGLAFNAEGKVVGLHYRNPKTATLLDVPTYTFPLATIAVMNLLLLKLSFPFGAWLEL